jgi:hypothetical protein
MSKGQKKHDLTIFYILFPPLLAFIFIYFYPIYTIFQIFLSKPIILFLIPTWLSTFFISFTKKLAKIKVTKEIREKVLFYSIFITFLVLYFHFFKGSTLILAQTSPYVCSDDYHCPADQRYCDGDTFVFVDYYCLNGICKSTTTRTNCNAFDGPVCYGEELLVYRDWFCDVLGCNFMITSQVHCNNYDGYYCEGSRRVYRDYYCTSGSCAYNVYSSYDCASLNGCQGRKYVTYTCQAGTCVESSRTCSFTCGAQCETNNDCSPN